jgi:hypothetical protein
MGFYGQNEACFWLELTLFLKPDYHHYKLLIVRLDIDPFEPA